MSEIKATAITRETLPMLVLMALGSTLAGLFLSAAHSSLDALPGLLVLVPAMQNLKGSIGGSLASRLSTALHQGTVRPSIFGNPELPPFAVASLSLSGTMSLIVGCVAFLFCLIWRIDSLGLVGMVVTSVFVGVSAGTAHLCLNIGVSILSYRRGLDPDNIAIPSLAIFGDIVSMAAFLLVVRAVA